MIFAQNENINLLQFNLMNPFVSHYVMRAYLVKLQTSLFVPHVTIINPAGLAGWGYMLSLCDYFHWVANTQNTLQEIKKTCLQKVQLCLEDRRLQGVQSGPDGGGETSKPLDINMQTCAWDRWEHLAVWKLNLHLWSAQQFKSTDETD